MIAVVGPGKGGSELLNELVGMGLFFPAGHGQGRAYRWLPSAGRIRLEQPRLRTGMRKRDRTGRGDRRRRADLHRRRQPPDLYWAARGSGPGSSPWSPPSISSYTAGRPSSAAVYAYSTDYADEIFTWARSISGDIDRRVELQIVATSDVPNAGIDRPAIVMASPVFADTEAEAREAFGILDRCPVVDKRWSLFRTRRWRCPRGTRR